VQPYLKTHSIFTNCPEFKKIKLKNSRRNSKKLDKIRSIKKKLNKWKKSKENNKNLRICLDPKSKRIGKKLKRKKRKKKRKIQLEHFLKTNMSSQKKSFKKENNI